MKEQILIVWARVKSFLQGLSFRTGVVVLLSCVVFYLLSFGVLAMPLPVGLRGALWALFFCLAKSAQYGGLLILGAEGVRRVKRWFGRDRSEGVYRVVITLYFISRSGFFFIKASHDEDPLAAFLPPPRPLTRAGPMAKDMGVRAVK